MTPPRSSGLGLRSEPPWHAATPANGCSAPRPMRGLHRHPGRPGMAYGVRTGPAAGMRSGRLVAQARARAGRLGQGRGRRERSPPRQRVGTACPHRELCPSVRELSGHKAPLVGVGNSPRPHACPVWLDLDADQVVVWASPPGAEQGLGAHGATGHGCRPPSLEPGPPAALRRFIRAWSRGAAAVLRGRGCAGPWGARCQSQDKRLQGSANAGHAASRRALVVVMAQGASRVDPRVESGLLAWRSWSRGSTSPSRGCQCPVARAHCSNGRLSSRPAPEPPRGSDGVPATCGHGATGGSHRV